MAFLGAEAVMDEMEAVLQAGMEATVAAVNAAYSDGVTITVPAASCYRRVFDPDDQNELDTYEYPLVVIRPEPEDVGDGPDIGDEYAIATPIEVAVVVGYDDAATQQKQLLRYMRAIKTILAPEASLVTGSVAYAGGGFARTWTADSGVIRDIAMIFVVTVNETP